MVVGSQLHYTRKGEAVREIDKPLYAVLMPDGTLGTDNDDKDGSAWVTFSKTFAERESKVAFCHKCHAHGTVFVFNEIDKPLYAIRMGDGTLATDLLDKDDSVWVTFNKAYAEREAASLSAMLDGMLAEVVLYKAD